MNITIKPYSQEYAKQCADLEQHLWKEDEKGRESRFDWAYTNCPVHEKPLCVIVVFSLLFISLSSIRLFKKYYLKNQ